MGRPHPRSNYQVVDADSSMVHVRAANDWTAISVGLNDLELRLPSTGAVQFRVEFRRWAAYAVGFSGLLGLIGLILLFTLDVRSYIAEHASARVPGVRRSESRDRVGDGAVLGLCVAVAAHRPVQTTTSSPR